MQVVEAYPDTGRRVFQTVLTEFEKFLEHYFKNQNEATIKGVSLAQQVEQRETMAIQYTIEMRRMLNEVPVQDGVRQFLFQVWADVLATTGVRNGAQSDQTRAMKRAAADLIWSASAKVTREERAEVIRRLPALLKALREGMAVAGLDTARQDEQIRQLNDSLAAAFTAKAAVIPHERLQEMMERLETLEELLPEAADVAIDESMVLDLSGHESADLEVITEGGSMPTQAMIAWARELQVGSWYMLDCRGRNEAVQLAWQGLRKQLSLFVGPKGRCVLFQQQRLAAFLQAGLILPAQDEALTVRATRSALAKLDVDCLSLGGLRSVDHPVFGCDEKFVQDQRVGLFAQAPEHHQDDDLDVVQVHRAGTTDGGGAVEHHLAHRRRQHAGRFEEADEADGFIAQQLALGLGVDAVAVEAAGRPRWPRRWWPDRPASAARPGSRRARSRLPRACATAACGPDRHPDASSFRTGTRAHRTSIHYTPARRWNSPPGSRATWPSSSSSSRRTFSSAADQPVRAPRASSVTGSWPRAASKGSSVGASSAVGSASFCWPGAGPCSSSSTSCAVSTSLAPRRISAWQPRDCGAWMDPGMANTSRPAFRGQPRGDQRARLQRCFDHQRAARQARDDAVAQREVLRQRRCARQVLRQDQPTLAHPLRQARWRAG